MTEHAESRGSDTSNTRRGLLDDYIHRDEIIRCFGIKEASFYDKVKKTGLKPIALSTCYYRIDDVKRTLLSPLGYSDAHGEQKPKRGRPRKIMDTKKTP